MGHAVRTLHQNEVHWNEGDRTQDSNISARVVYGPPLWILVFGRTFSFAWANRISPRTHTLLLKSGNTLRSQCRVLLLYAVIASKEIWSYTLYITVGRYSNKVRSNLIPQFIFYSSLLYESQACIIRKQVVTKLSAMK